MTKLAIAFGLVLAADILGGVFGFIAADVAVAIYLGIVWMSAGLLILTSRPALAPVGQISRRSIPAISEGIAVHAAAGAGRYAHA